MVRKYTEKWMNVTSLLKNADVQNSGTPAGRASASTLSPHGPMYNICKQFRTLLSKDIRTFCSIFIANNQPGKYVNCVKLLFAKSNIIIVVSMKLGLLELETLDIIFYLLVDASDRSQTLDGIPEDFWMILVEAFLEKS